MRFLCIAWICFIQTVSFVAARQERPDRQKPITTSTINRREATNPPDPQETSVRTSTENKNSKQE